MTDDAPRIEAEILRLAAARGPGKSICPSEVARALVPGHDDDMAEAAWRPLMGPVRRAAIGLATGGFIDILRKGKPVDPGQEVRGVIRLRIRAPSGDNI